METKIYNKDNLNDLCKEAREVIKTEYTEEDIENGAEFLVLTDEEADAMLLEKLENEAWTYQASFLAEMTELPEEVFKALSKTDDRSNDAILTLIDKTCGREAFIDYAVKLDGRGHFLAGYDFAENEARTEDSIDLYIYRIN